jgi:peptide/nickel transport system substrate-binding protein
MTASRKRPASRHWRGAAGLAGAACVIFTVAGCGGSAGSTASAANGATKSAAAPSAGPLVWAVNADVTGMDPQNNGQDVSQNIMSLVYQHLVTLGDGTHISPQLAASYKEVSPTVYVFTLRTDVKFSNGRTMTADDVVGSFNRILSKSEASYLAGRLSAIKSVKATGADTVEFTLSQPDAGFLQALADPAAAILPMKELNAGSFNPDKEMLGTGPYVVASHQQGSSWSFTKNPYYWQPGLPKISTVQITILPDQTTQIAALRGGSADIATFSSSEAASLTSSIPGMKVVTQTGTEYYALLLNDVSSPQLKNVKVRQAINLAISRAQVASVGLGGNGVPVGPAPGLPDSCPVSSLPYSTQDIAKAKQLLASAGGVSKPLTLQYDTTFPDMANIAQVIKTELAAIGLQVNLQPLPDAQDIKDLVAGDFDLGMTFYGSGTDVYFGLTDWSPTLSGFTSKFNAPVAAIEASLPLVASETGAARTQAISKACTAADADSAQIPLDSKNLTIAWNTSKLSANVLGAENASDPLRDIATYSMG